MGKVQKVYTREFKEEAVRLAQTSGKPIAQVARELGISDTSIHQWRKELAEHGKEAFPGSGHQTAVLATCHIRPLIQDFESTFPCLSQLAESLWKRRIEMHVSTHLQKR
jgi:transposase-like protein